MSDLAEEIIWATSTTGEEFQCVHVDFAREQDSEIRRLTNLLGLHTEERIARAEAEIDQLKSSLRQYGSHVDNCPVQTGEGVCNCGWRRLDEQLSGLSPASEANHE